MESQIITLFFGDDSVASTVDGRKSVPGRPTVFVPKIHIEALPKLFQKTDPHPIKSAFEFSGNEGADGTEALVAGQVGMFEESAEEVVEVFGERFDGRQPSTYEGPAPGTQKLVTPGPGGGAIGAKEIIEGLDRKTGRPQFVRD